MINLNILILAVHKNPTLRDKIDHNMRPVYDKLALINTINQILTLDASNIIIVIEENSPLEDEINAYFPNNNFRYIVRNTTLGCGYDVMSAIYYIPRHENVMIVPRSMPFINDDTIHLIYQKYKATQSDLIIATMHVDNPSGYDRIIIGQNGNVIEILKTFEVYDRSSAIKLVDSGVYIITSNLLHMYVPLIMNYNKHKKYYFTDIVRIINKESLRYSVNMYVGHAYE